MNLQSSITELKGIGEKTSLPFAKVGIHTVLDLLEYYPRDYEIYEEPVELTEIESGKKYAVHGKDMPCLPNAVPKDEIFR